MQKITETRAPFLVGLIESWDDEENIFYVMRLYPQTLRDRMSCRPRMTRCQTRYHIAEMVIALHWLHTNGIVHRDIKPENILMTPRGHLVIGDYGLSRMVPDGTPVSEWRIERECAGSPGYSAPEVISSPYTYGIMADVYSLGLVSAEMASRRITPYFVCRTASEQLAMMKKQYRDGEFIPDNGLQIEDEHEKDLVLKTLKWDPSQRPTTAELKVHPYFDGIDWAMLNLRRYQVDVVPTTVKLSEEYPSYDFFTFKQGKDKTAYYGEDVEYDKHRHILPNNAVKAQLGEDRAKQVEYRYLCPAPLRHDDLHGHCTLDPPSPAGCP
ncbi:kinase-like protein [Obba rivulosa]|uniref:Kinase-like protein n=1 Tax=Obba rivulosa TaxID=1052685 RepID=A0A8E2DDV9_9APHY|nr:kinase-like protein [Obba rivulosa]